MDEPTPKKLVLLSLLTAVLSVVFFRDIKSIIDTSFFKDKYVLVIGILSAPENFQRRLSVRKTWAKLTTDISAAYYFVVGEHICRIHPLDRVSPYSCVENLAYFPDNATSDTEFSTIKPRKINKKQQQYKPTIVSAIGFGFHTLRSISVRRLGVLRQALENARSDVRVRLVSTSTQKTLASVTLTPSGVSHKDDDVILKSIRPVGLKNGAEAQVVMEVLDKRWGMLPSCDGFEWDHTTGSVGYDQLIDDGSKKPWPFAEKSCSYAVMKYAIPDVEAAKSHAARREHRRREWRSEVKALTARLKNESDVYGDLVFVDTVDVYRNLPRKLILFFKMLMESDYFHYVLKTDDDTFVDVLRVYKQLVAVSRNMDEEIRSLFKEPVKGVITTIRLSRFWWWSNFRESWKVQESGKWREDKYRSPAYPAFPCGGGYVLSRGVVDYLSANSRNLQYFQGEDVSVGIWLSGLNTIHYRTPRVSPRSQTAVRSVQEKVISSYRGVREWAQFLDVMNVTGSRRVSDACEWTCDNERRLDVPMCNKVDLTVSEMYEAWRRYIQYGFI